MASTPSWQTPATYHTAFNPAAFIAELNSQDIETVTLRIYDAGLNRLFQTLKAETFEGIARFDVSSVVRTAFNRQLGIAFYDRALSFRYRAVGPNDVNLGTFIALNAAAQVGESSDMSAWLNKALTRFDSLRKYTGYDLTVAVLTSNGTTHTTYTGTAIGGKAVVAACTPDQPFYVRWINMQGGVDYWMFSRRQEFEESVKQVSSYEVVVDSVARTNSRAYSVTTENRVTVGADDIPPEDYNVLKRLPFSPSIEWYNESLAKWIALSPAKFTGKMRTRDKRHSIEATFDLPRLILQY